jgi:hypothetical protein
MSAQPSTEVLMQPADSRRKLLLWSALIVAAHFLAVLWHVVLLVKVQPGFPGIAILALVLINLCPVAALVVFTKGRSKLAGSMIIIPLGIALVIGGYTHFLSSGSDNVLRMPASELALSFQISAVLLAVLEALGCWVGVKIYTSR